MESDIIQSLIETPFEKCSEEEQLSVINQGRPVPSFAMVRTYKTQSRTFQPKWYKEYNWLCGSARQLKLFCWPCLLMGRTGVWTTDGYDDMKNLTRGLSRHSASKEHLNAQLALNTRVKLLAFSVQQPTELSKLETLKYNEQVRKNREIFTVLLDVAMILCKQDLAYQWCDDSNDPTVNSENFNSILSLTLNWNAELRQHWDDIGEFRESKTIQNEIMLVIQGEIQKVIDGNINDASFYSCIVNGSIDTNGQPQCSIILRLVDTNGDIQEHFVGFFFTKKQRTANSIFEVVSSALEKYCMKNKLVAQAYDGVCIMSGELSDLEDKVREVAPQALFTHCYAYSLNLVLQQSCSNIESVRLFFSTLQGISEFFVQSSKRSAVLDKALGQSVLTNSGVDWDVSSKFTSAVHSNRLKLIEVFEELMSSADAQTMREAQGYFNNLTDFTFIFLLSIFQQIFEKTEALSDILQGNSREAFISEKSFLSCLTVLKGMRSQQKLDEFYELAERTSKCGPSLKRQKLSNGLTISSTENFEQIYFDILDSIITQLEVRFGNRDRDAVKFLKLGDSFRFIEYHCKFPNDAVIALISTYGIYFNEEQLKAELKTIFSPTHAEEFHNMKLIELIKKMKNGGVDKILSEAYTMFTLLATIPSPSSTDDRSSLCLSQVDKYLKSSTTHHRPAGLALISIEKNLLSKLESSSSWNDNLIQSYAMKKNQNVNLLLK